MDGREADRARPDAHRRRTDVPWTQVAVAEDHYVVLLTNAKVKVPAGSYTGAVITAEWTPLEPDVLSEKAYAKGIGEVSESDVKGGDEKFELVSVATK